MVLFAAPGGMIRNVVLEYRGQTIRITLCRRLQAFAPRVCPLGWNGRCDKAQAAGYWVFVTPASGIQIARDQVRGQLHLPPALRRFRCPLPRCAVRGVHGALLALHKEAEPPLERHGRSSPERYMAMDFSSPASRVMASLNVGSTRLPVVYAAQHEESPPSQPTLGAASAIGSG